MNWITYLVQRTHSARVFFHILFRTLPFTVLLITAILAIGAITNTLAHPISAAAVERWGFGFEQMRAGRIYQLFIAPFQILRPYMAISITAIVVLFVGGCEYRLGTWRAAVAFWTGHIVGYAGGSLLLTLLGRAGSAWAMKASLATDVGASSGAFGAAGAVVLFLGGRTRKITFALISAYLVAALLVDHRNWDVEHVLAFAAGLVLGRTYLWNTGRRWPGLFPRWQIEHRQRPGFVSSILRLTGAINIMAAFLLPHHARLERLEEWLPIGSPHWPRHLLLVTGFALLFLAPGLARRQRSAWWGALIALAISLLLHLQVGVNRIGAAIAAVFIFLLVAWRRDFRAPAHAPSLRSGIGLLALLVIAVPLYGLLGFYVLRSRFDPPVTVFGALVETVSRAAFYSTQMFVASGRPAQWFLESIPVVAWLGVVVVITLVIRSSLAPEVSRSDLEVARELLKHHGDSGTSYMTLWRGNSLFFGPEQRCYAAYRVNSGVALVLGDPVGEPGAVAETIRDFSQHADDRGWTPVFYATTRAYLHDYAQAGYEQLQIGEEAVISLPRLEFRGKEWQTVRSAGNRAARTGVTFQMFEGGTIPPEIRAQLFEISAEWAARQELPPMGFTLGKTEDVDDPNVNVAVAVDAAKRVHGFVDWLPVYSRRGWVIDLMRRRDDAMTGVMDFLIGTSLMAFKERGYETASLATAPLADLHRGEAASLLQWVLGKVYEKSQTYYDFRSLFRYKQKFQPEWESIYLIHRGLTGLPAIAAALIRAYLPGLGLTEAARLVGESAARLLFPKDKPTA